MSSAGALSAGVPEDTRGRLGIGHLLCAGADVLTVGELLIVGGAWKAGDPLSADGRVSTGCRASAGDLRGTEEELYVSEPPTAGGILSAGYPY